MSELIGFDTETYLFSPGNMAPRPVCASFFDGSEGWFERFREGAVDTIEGLWRVGMTLAVANGPYDFAVVARHVPSFLKAIFAKYERGEVWDVETVAALDAIADGRMLDGMVLNRDFQPLRRFGDTGKVTNRFSLSNCVWLYLNRLDAKANDEFRLAYGELDMLPTEQWPEKAKVYPVDDARNTYDVAQVQRAHSKNTGPVGGLKGVTWPTFQARAAFAMHLGSVWGLRTNADRIAAIEAKVTTYTDMPEELIASLGLTSQGKGRVLTADLRVLFAKHGMLKPDGSDNRSGIKYAVALAYGADANALCETCKGTRKVPSEKTGKPVNCKVCDSTGLLLPDSVPRTPADGIAADRDTLEGTGNELLEAWAYAGKNNKMIQTYLPWLKEGIKHPINVRPNALVATGRCSYEGLVQLIPPLARECFEARTTVVYLEVPDSYQLAEGEEWA